MKFESAIIKSLQTCLPTFQFILADRKGVEPAAPYCLVTIIDVINHGRPYLTTANKDGVEVEQISQNKIVNFSLTLHALATDQQQDDFERFHMGIGSTFVTSTFANNGLGILEYTDIIYQSTPVNEISYKRAIIDISIFCERTEEYYSPFIKVVETHGDLIDSDKDFDLTTDFNIN
ncbi:Uncharacterised protein [Acinetobacter phage MD-2021a]|nr:Uncharacterised protein [Acinetobacter phage MD-2021a]CAH1088746.1 Uncharacterised protein [Acinetobacter phage MD-2021a]